MREKQAPERILTSLWAVFLMVDARHLALEEEQEPNVRLAGG